MKSELSGLGHLAEAGAQAEEGIAADTRGEVGNGETDVVDLYSTIFVSLCCPCSGHSRLVVVVGIAVVVVAVVVHSTRPECKGWVISGEVDVR